MSEITVLISQPDGTFEVKKIKQDLEVLQAIVGGYLEAITREDWMIYFNEEGKLDGLPYNKASTIMLDTLVPGFAQGDILVGSVIWLGGVNQHGSATSVHQDIIEVFGEMTATLTREAGATE